MSEEDMARDMDQVSATEFGTHSIVSAPSNKADSEDIKDYATEEREGPVEIPKKGLSAYAWVSVLCLMVAFGGFIFGWDIGTIGGFINQTDYLRRFGQQASDGTYYFTNARVGLIVSIFCIGCAIGGVVFARLGDTLGRKKALVIVVIVYMVGVVVAIASEYAWYQYFIGRIICGLGIGGIAVFSPMLISEVSPKHLRGSLVSCYQLMITMGIFLGNCANYGTKVYDDSRQWRVPLGLCFAWALLMIVAMMFVPESPRFLVEVGKIEEAKRSVATSNRLTVDDPGVIGEVETVQAAVESERLAGSASWADLFNTKDKIFQRLFMGSMIQSLQQLTGCNYFFYYGNTIFKSVGMSDSYVTAIVLSTVNFISTFFALYFVDKFGRRSCLLAGALGMAVFMLIYACVGTAALYPDGDDQPSSIPAGNTMIVFACLFIFCFATTWAPIPFVVNSESYPLRVKTKCMAIAQGCNWIWNFLIGFFTPFIAGDIDFAYGFVFFGCLVFSFFYVFFFVPESKGLALEEVNTMWEEGVLPWKSAAWVPPSKRGADYEADALMHDDKPMMKRLFHM